MSDLIDDLLVAARADIGKVAIRPEPVDIVSCVEQVVATCSLADRARISIKGDGIVGWVDPVRLRQVLRNLITNAIRYGGPLIDVKVDGAADVQQLWSPTMAPAYRRRIENASLIPTNERSQRAGCRVRLDWG